MGPKSGSQSHYRFVSAPANASEIFTFLLLFRYQSSCQSLFILTTLCAEEEDYSSDGEWQNAVVSSNFLGRGN